MYQRRGYTYDDHYFPGGGRLKANFSLSQGERLLVDVFHAARHLLSGSFPVMDLPLPVSEIATQNKTTNTWPTV